MINAADLKAIADVLRQFNKEIENLTVEQSVRYAKDIDDVKKQAKLAAEFLKTRTLNLIEKQPVVVDGNAYMRKAVKKWRPDQRKIQSAVAWRAVIDPETGEKIEEPLIAAANAVMLMYDLFVAPSEMPKQGGLEKLNLTNMDVAEHVTVGHQLKTVEIEPDDD